MFARSRQGAVDVIAGDDPLTADGLVGVARLCDELLAAGQPRAVLDLGRVALIDSTGLEWLLTSQEKFVQRGGAIKLAAPNQLCRDILLATGVDRHFEVFADAVAAVGSFAR
ncbi:MAG TPA: STAS domain-containing protein [Pirellulales bacterium]|jgi:anti-anti-sigma factor|nr:STAS domain-containing protein [Pirellulales bacterium]